MLNAQSSNIKLIFTICSMRNHEQTMNLQVKQQNSNNDSNKPLLFSYFEVAFLILYTDPEAQIMLTKGYWNLSWCLIIINLIVFYVLNDKIHYFRWFSQ